MEIPLMHLVARKKGVISKYNQDMEVDARSTPGSMERQQKTLDQSPVPWSTVHSVIL
jgi:hypothetical protein